MPETRIYEGGVCPGRPRTFKTQGHQSKPIAAHYPGNILKDGRLVCIHCRVVFAPTTSTVVPEEDDA